jgi:hypothetical protein
VRRLGARHHGGPRHRQDGDRSELRRSSRGLTCEEGLRPHGMSVSTCATPGCAMATGPARPRDVGAERESESGSAPGSRCRHAPSGATPPPAAAGAGGGGAVVERQSCTRATARRGRRGRALRICAGRGGRVPFGGDATARFVERMVMGGRHVTDAQSIRVRGNRCAPERRGRGARP